MLTIVCERQWFHIHERHCEEFSEPEAIVWVAVADDVVVGAITVGGALGVTVTFTRSVR